ncbi:maleylpyruvate isomerase family mycothiol-dependent enzyme [Actinophytocola sp.]|uniref:maleylpyruvate isomerase family mycothiol-dependent enzyme n=1 Tax=Actinophytocola sp. TaxID=1872138 RepID=UPI00389A6210
MSPELSAERCRQALLDHTRRLAECALAAGGDAAVPTCPEWTVAGLVQHVGQTQRWVSELIERRVTDPSELPTEMAEPPAEPQAWPAWLSDAAARAAAACSDAALEASVFNAAGDNRTGAQFWLHSLLNEAVVHGFDAAVAAGHDYDLDADIAAGLITNHLAMLTSPTWAAQRPDSAAAMRGTNETLHWHATDEPGLGAAGEWFIERRPDGVSWQHGHGKADVTVHGPAKSLLLVLTRRLPLTGAHADGVTIDGNAELAQHWLGHTAHVAG